MMISFIIIVCFEAVELNDSSEQELCGIYPVVTIGVYSKHSWQKTHFNAVAK